MAQNWMHDFFPVNIASSIFYRPLLVLSKHSTDRPVRETQPKFLSIPNMLDL